MMSYFSFLIAAQIFNSPANLENYVLDAENFYEFYLAEQKDIDSSIGLNIPARNVRQLNPPPLPNNPPADPPAPTPSAGYLPFVIVNNSGIPDNEVYVTIIGAQLIGTTAQTQKMYVTFSGSGVGSYTFIPGSGSGSITPVALDTINTASAPHTYSFYIPASDNGSDGISGARLYFQMKNNTSLITYDTGKITEPSVLNQSLTSYSVSFDKFEFAYVPAGSPQVAANATAVDFFCLPLYGYLSTPDAGSSNHSGLYESQSFIMNSVIPYFFDNVCTSSAILAQWNNLYSPNKSSPIRVLSPQSGMSVPANSTFPNKFDPNYFDNASAYGFSLIGYLWNGARSYYKTNGLYFAIPTSNSYPQPPGGVYTASIGSNNNMNFSPAFTTESQSYFTAPTTQDPNNPNPSGPTSFVIASAQNLNTTFAANLQGNQVSKLFEEAVMVGLLPASFTSSNPLSNSYLSANVSSYYSNSSKLPATAGGPWYSVYSQAIHYIGNIYTFGFDEPLYPTVLMQCTTPTSSTYIGITINECDLVP